MNVEDNQEEQEEVVSTVSLRTGNRSSLRNESVLSVDPSTLMKMVKFLKILDGRIIYMKATKAAEKFVVSPKNSYGLRDLTDTDSVARYHTAIMMFLLRRRMQTHIFHSEYNAELLGNRNHRRKQLEAMDPHNAKEIRRNAAKIIDKAVELQTLVSDERKMTQDLLYYNLTYPAFYNKCKTTIENQKLIASERRVDKRLKQLMKTEQNQIRFLGEFCSRLLAVTPVTSPVLINALKSSNEILYELYKYLA